MPSAESRPRCAMASTSPERGGFPESPFWDFSLATYGRPGVASACLGLQERRGTDVNVLLFCCWVGASGRGKLGEEGMAAARAAAHPWQAHVVVPLRGARKALKGRGEPAEVLRKRVAAVEIDTEHVEQLALEATVTQPADAGRPETARMADATANLAGYFAALGIAPDESDRADAATILAGAFPEADKIDGILNSP